MLENLLSQMKAYRYLVEVEVSQVDDERFQAVAKHRFLMGKQWKTLGFLQADFHRKHYEIQWAAFDLPPSSREFLEYKTILAIKKKISAVWGFDRMLEFEDLLEKSSLRL